MKLIEFKKLIDESVKQYGEELEVVTTVFNDKNDDHFKTVTTKDFKANTKQKVFIIF